MENYIWRRSNYKLMTGKWKIGILLEAGYRIVPIIEKWIKGEKQVIKVTEQIYFSSMLLPYPVSQTMLEEEMEYFCDGLRRVGDMISVLVERDCFIIIGLRQICFSVCDIQNEAFTACAIQWASEIFQFPMPDIRVYFDDSKLRNGQYVFDFSNVAKKFPIL